MVLEVGINTVKPQLSRPEAGVVQDSKTIRIYPYCAQDTTMEMHSRDITLLIVLL